jgi:hypothetical protein
MRTLYTFMTIALLLSSYSMSPIVAGEMPVLVKKKPERMIEKFSELKNSKNRMVGNKNTYVVKDQMLHYFNGEDYDTASTFHYEYVWSVLVSEILTRDYIDGNFENSQLELYYRDEKGRDTTVVQQYWNDDKKGWENNWKEVVLYDDHDNEVMYGFYVWNIGEWILDWGSQMDYEYNEDGNILSLTYSYYSWNNWNLDWRDLMEYDNNGHLVAMMEQYWDDINDEWMNDYREEYQYTNNEWSEIFGFYWDDWEAEWINEMWVQNIIWFNFSSFLWEEYTLLEHDGDGWVNSEQGFAEYNSMNLPMKIQYEMWYGNSWENDWRFIWEYDSFYNVTLMTEEEWFGSEWELAGGSKYDYEYDTYNNIATEYLQIYYAPVKGWEKIQKLQSWYEDVSGIPSKENGAFTINLFPNPTDGYLNIQVLKADHDLPVNFQILDLSGRNIMAGQLDPSIGVLKLNIQNISNGVYIFRTESGNRTENRKIIKR